MNFQRFSDYPKQIDSYNCGVYVLYYAECMIKNKIENIKFNMNFSPMVHIEVLKDLLLEKSYFMKDICLYCRRTVKKNKEIKKKKISIGCNAIHVTDG